MTIATVAAMPGIVTANALWQNDPFEAFAWNVNFGNHGRTVHQPERSIAMTTLDYASKPIRKPYRYFFLISGMVCLFVAGTFFLCAAYVPPGFPGPQKWMRFLEGASTAVVFPSIIAGLCALTMLFFRFQSIPHSVAVVITAIVCIIGVPLVHIGAESELRSAYPHALYVQFMNDGRRLSIAASSYSSYHNGRYPPHPAALVLEGMPVANLLASRVYAPFIPPSPLPPASDWPTIAPDVDAHSIFVYAAGDYDNIVPPANAILIYTKSCSATPGHRVVIFGDERHQLIPEKDLPKYFAESNAARAKLGLPPFVLDGPPPKPSATLPAAP